VEVKNDALSAFILGKHPGTVKTGKIMFFDENTGAMNGAHDLAQLTLAFTNSIQRKIAQQRLQHRYLSTNSFSGYRHNTPPFSTFYSKKQEKTTKIFQLIYVKEQSRSCVSNCGFMSLSVRVQQLLHKK
jgi:hypothetical protein